MAQVTELEAAYLAGLWDGEGSITIFSHQEKAGQKKICPMLNLVNTNEAIIAEACRILDKAGTSFHVTNNKANSRNANHKDATYISTRNIQHIKTTLDVLLPYLVGKRPQAILLLRYVDKKLAQRAAGVARPRYDDEDWELQAQTQILNKRGPVKSSEPSEATRLDS
jgi:hypothetical protein